MGLLKFMILGLIAGIGVPTLMLESEGMLAEATRWRGIMFTVGGTHLVFSVAIFAVVTLSGWILIFSARE